MRESNDRVIRQRSMQPDEVGANGLGDAEIAWRGGSALNRCRQQIGPPSKIHRSLSDDATRRNVMIGESEMSRVTIDDYEMSTRGKR